MGNPQQVADVVGGALDARNPRDRNLVGMDGLAARDLAVQLGVAEQRPRAVLVRRARGTP